MPTGATSLPRKGNHASRHEAAKYTYRPGHTINQNIRLGTCRILFDRHLIQRKSSFETLQGAVVATKQQKLRLQFGHMVLGIGFRRIRTLFFQN